MVQYGDRARSQDRPQQACEWRRAKRLTSRSWRLRDMQSHSPCPLHQLYVSRFTTVSGVLTRLQTHSQEASLVLGCICQWGRGTVSSHAVAATWRMYSYASTFFRRAGDSAVLFACPNTESYIHTCIRARWVMPRIDMG